MEKFWCGRRDLNPGLPAWKAGVLIQARRRPLKPTYRVSSVRLKALLKITKGEYVLLTFANRKY